MRTDGWTSIGSYEGDEAGLIFVSCPKHGSRDYQSLAAAEAAVRMHDYCEAQISPLAAAVSEVGSDTDTYVHQEKQ